MSKASVFMSPSSRAPMSPRVAGVDGQCNDTISAVASSSSRLTRPCAGGAPGRLQMIERMPNASPTAATPRPSVPHPTMPSARPDSSRMGYASTAYFSFATQEPSVASRAYSFRC
jgi:hypothetical protein